MFGKIVPIIMMLAIAVSIVGCGEEENNRHAANSCHRVL